MSFKADHERIRLFGNHLLHLVDDANDAKAYVLEHLNPTVRYDMSRIFFTLAQAAEQVADALVTNYNHLAVVATESGVELEKAADRYRRNDRRGAGRISAAGRS